MDVSFGGQHERFKNIWQLFNIMVPKTATKKALLEENLQNNPFLHAVKKRGAAVRV